MNKSNYDRRWSKLFLVAALFNYSIGIPILFLSRWSFDRSFVEAVDRVPVAIWLWADFGFVVLLIGYGYQIISRNIRKNRGIVLLGMIAKLFDVINLSLLYAWGYARPLVLIPAFIDGLFAIAFAVFWFSRPPDE